MGATPLSLISKHICFLNLPPWRLGGTLREAEASTSKKIEHHDRPPVNEKTRRNLT